MISYFLTGFAFVSVNADSSKIDSLMASPENKIIPGQPSDWWIICVTIAIALVGAAALCLAISQRRESIRAYRIAILSSLLEQLTVVQNTLKSEDLERWLHAIMSLMVKWIPKEAREIQTELEKQSKNEG